MKVKFFDIEDETNRLNGTDVRDVKLLLQIFNDLRGREPFFCELVGDNDHELLVGIGAVGCAQFGRSGVRPPYFMAVAPGSHDPGETEFLAGGTPTPVSNRYCMPFSSICEIVAHFLETGHVHPSFAWEEI